MKSIGIIETDSLAAAILAVDAAGKTGDIEIVAKEFGAKNTTLVLSGETATLEMSIKAAATAAKESGAEVLSAVINKPSADMEEFIEGLPSFTGNKTVQAITASRS